MLDGFPLSAVDLAPSALLGIAVLMLFFGRLWTNKAYQEKKEEAERWRKAYELERDGRIASDAQTKELLEIGKATYSILDAMFSSVEPPGKGGAHRVVHQTSR